MNNFDLQELIKNIQAGMRCPHCHAAYKEENISVLGCVGNVCLVHLECGVCLKPVLATVMVEEKKTVKRETSFSKKPAFSKKNFAEKVNADDIIALHQFLENFDGNFARLFKDEISEEN